MFSLLLFLLTGAALAASTVYDRKRTCQALNASLKSLLGLMPSLLGLTALVGLALALVPPEYVANLFARGGPSGFILALLVGSITTIPSPVAFPLAGSLLKLGASPSAMAAFITTLTLVGVVTIPMERSYFGLRFALVRNGWSFVLAIVVGIVMGVAFR